MKETKASEVEATVERKWTYEGLIINDGVTHAVCTVIKAWDATLQFWTHFDTPVVLKNMHPLNKQMCLLECRLHP